MNRYFSVVGDPETTLSSKNLYHYAEVGNVEDENVNVAGCLVLEKLFIKAFPKRRGTSTRPLAG